MTMRHALMGLLLSLAATHAAVTWTNIVTELPLPGGGVYRHETQVRVRTAAPAAAAAAIDDTTPPSTPTNLRARAVRPWDLRWPAPPPGSETNFVFVIYSATNLMLPARWPVHAVLPPTARTMPMDEHNPGYPMRFYKVSASNEVGEVFIKRVPESRLK